MFIRQCYRRKDGKRHAYWALVESYRTKRGPRQRVVAWLGQMDEAGRLGVQEAVTERADPTHQKRLFDNSEPAPRWVEVDASAVRVENSRQFGGPWLALELIGKLGLAEFFERVLPRGRESVPWSASALILIVARLCQPSSELHTSEQWYPQTSLPELLGVPPSPRSRAARGARQWPRAPGPRRPEPEPTPGSCALSGIDRRPSRRPYRGDIAPGLRGRR